MSKDDIPSFPPLDTTSVPDDNLDSHLKEVHGVANPRLGQQPEAPPRARVPPPASHTTPTTTTTTEVPLPAAHVTAIKSKASTMGEDAAIDDVIDAVNKLHAAFVNGEIPEDLYVAMNKVFKSIIRKPRTAPVDETRRANNGCMSGPGHMLVKYHEFNLKEVLLIFPLLGPNPGRMSPRLVDIVGYLGDSANKYFESCRRYDELRSGSGIVEKDAVPLLCTVGAAGQGKTELCFEILRRLAQRRASQAESTAFCGVWVTFGEGHDWGMRPIFQAWDHCGIVFGLWARIGEMIKIGNWQSFKPTSIANIFEMLHLITKKQNPDAATTEVHLLVDETLRITDEEQRQQLLLQVGDAVHSSINEGDKKRSYALVTSLRGVPIEKDMADSMNHRKIHSLPLFPPTQVRSKIAQALLTRVMCDLWKMHMIADTSAFSGTFSECLAEMPSTGSPTVVNQNDFMAVMQRHTSLQLAKPEEALNPHYLPVKAAVFYTIYSVTTWRSFERFFSAAAEASFLKGILADPTKVPTVGRCYWGDDALADDKEKPPLIQSCTQQLMRLCAAWEAVVAGHLPKDTVVDESTIMDELKENVMWIFQRDEMASQQCIPFVNLRFLRNVSTQEPLLLSPVEKVFWDTYKVLATNLMDVKDIRDLPAAFERAVVLSLALRLLALNRNAASPEVSASLGELLPEPQFKNNGTKLLQLRRRVCGDAFALQQFSGTGAAVEVIKDADETAFAFTLEGRTADAKVIDVAMSLITPDGKPVVGAFSMNCQEGRHAQDAFGTVSAFLEAAHEGTLAGILVVAIVASPEEQSIDFTLTVCDCVFIGPKALQTLLAPFGASYLCEVMEAQE